MKLTFTPKKITQEIHKFCNEIIKGTNPVYLNVQPLPESKDRDCFVNVENFISGNGGSMQCGWRIWEWTGIMIEAEFHAVWLSPENIFVDITPAGHEQILFLPDNTKVYEGRQVNNIRFALINNPLVYEFIEVNNKIFEVMNEGELADKHGYISLPSHIIMPLRKRHGELAIMLYKLKASPNSPCFCGSGLKYKKCCK